MSESTCPAAAGAELTFSLLFLLFLLPRVQRCLFFPYQSTQLLPWMPSPQSAAAAAGQAQPWSEHESKVFRHALEIMHTLYKSSPSAITEAAVWLEISR